MKRLIFILLAAFVLGGCATAPLADGDSRVDSTDDVKSADGPVAPDPEDSRDD